MSTALLLLIGLLCVIVALSIDVRKRLNVVESGDSNNGLWVMMQTEVEVLRLQYAVSATIAGDQTPEDVRRWFDVVYSRIKMLTKSPLYTDFITRAEVAERLAAMQRFIDQWLPVMDGPDQALITALPQLEAETAAVQQIARAMSINSLLVFSSRTDETRAQISEALLRLAVTTAATILVLAVMAAILTRIYRVAARQAEENRVTGERLQSIVATSPDAIVVTNRGGWVVEFNTAAEEMFGLAREAIMGRQALPLIFAPEHIDRYQKTISAAITLATHGGPQRFELEGIRQNGERFPLELSISNREMISGSLIVAFLRDVSARKAGNVVLQEALTKARAGEKAKAKFLAVMSHEMRTPLNGLLGSIGLLRPSELDPDRQELLRIMEVSGEILLGHVNSVLDVSLSEAGEVRLNPTPFDLDRLIDDCIANQAELARTAGNVLRHDPLTSPLGLVFGDPGRLRQILLNLIGNAVKFTQHGRIIVETERLPARAADGMADIVEFRVVDTGMGIATKDLDRVFEDFETVDSSYGRQVGGTGLGLGIARRLAKAMGGQIGAESEAGQGSVFWVRLPLPVSLETPDLPLAPLEASPARPAALDPLQILVIEDNEINRFLLCRYLREAKHRVVEAVDGVEGVEVAHKTRFDLIITDISMPRMDGIEATRRIRSGNGASAKARIIALTAHALPDELARFRTAGMDACLIKPVTREVLMAHLSVEDTAAADAPTLRPVLDTGPLRELLADLGEGMVTDLISRMIHDGDATLSRLAGFDRPTDEVARLVHQLAGICATFGALRLREALATIEEALQAGAVDRATVLLAEMPALWAETRAALTHQADVLVA